MENTFTDEDIRTEPCVSKGRYVKSVAERVGDTFEGTGGNPERVCPYTGLGCLGYSKGCELDPCRELKASWTPQKRVCFKRMERSRR